MLRMFPGRSLGIQCFLAESRLEPPQMHPCVPHSSGLSCRSASFAIRPLPFVCRPLLFCSSVLSLVTLAHARRGSPVFDTDTIPDPTPCEAVTFSWTGGIPPYSLLVGSPDTITIVSEIDSITDLFVSWTPPSDSVDMTLVAFVFDDDESFDTTNDFVVQPASCLSPNPPSFPPSSVSAEPSTPPPYPISPIPRSTDSSSIPLQSVSTSTHTAPSGTPPPSSSPAQSPTDTTGTRSAGNGTSVTPLRPTTSTTGTLASSETVAPSQPHPSTTISHWRFTSRPRRKPPSSSPSASEIVGMVLGSVALVGVLIGIIVWRRMTVARGRAPCQRGSTSGPEEGDSGPAAGLESFCSTLVQQASQVFTKPIADRHRISAASTSPVTPVGIGLGPGSGPAPPLAEDEDGSDVLHIHNDTEANSIAVEPSTSCTDDTLVALLRPDSYPLKPPGLSPTRASKTEFPPLGGEGTREAVPAPVAGTKAREDVRASSDTYRTSSAPAPAPDPSVPPEEEEEAPLPGEAEAALSSGARTRRVTLTLIESDGGVRLAGGPQVDVVVEGERCPDGELLSESGDGSIEIVTLPPPYHHYNS